MGLRTQWKGSNHANSPERIHSDYPQPFDVGRKRKRQVTRTEMNLIERIGKVYKKAQYFEYEDRSFMTRKSINPDRVHMGILGPPIHAGFDLCFFTHNDSCGRHHQSVL